MWDLMSSRNESNYSTGYNPDKNVHVFRSRLGALDFRLFRSRKEVRLTHWSVLHSQRPAVMWPEISWVTCLELNRISSNASVKTHEA